MTRTVCTAAVIFAILLNIPAGLEAVNTGRAMTAAGASLLDLADPSSTVAEPLVAESALAEPALREHQPEVPPELLPFVVEDVEPIVPDIPRPAPPTVPPLPRPANPAFIRSVDDFVDWAPFERAAQANLGPDASVDQLDRFTSAAIGVCEGKLTVRNAVVGYQVDLSAVAALSAFVPAQCHLLPDQLLRADDDNIAGTAITDSWSEMIVLRWNQTAQWLSLREFESVVRSACTDDTAELPVMDRAAVAQVATALAHGECELLPTS